MVFIAADGTEDAYRDLVGEVAETVRDFMRFANAAIDAYLVYRMNRSG